MTISLYSVQVGILFQNKTFRYILYDKILSRNIKENQINGIICNGTGPLLRYTGYILKTVVFRTNNKQR